MPCVQYPGAYANMHMYMGDNKRTFTKSASFLPFIRVAFNTRGTRRAPANPTPFFCVEPMQSLFINISVAQTTISFAQAINDLQQLIVRSRRGADHRVPKAGERAHPVPSLS